MTSAPSDRTTSSGLVNYDEPLDVESHLTSIQARISTIEENQKKTQYLVLLNQETLTELINWFQGAKKSLRLLILFGNFLVWISKVGTAFLILYGIASAITGGKFPNMPGSKWFGGSGDHH